MWSGSARSIVTRHPPADERNWTSVRLGSVTENDSCCDWDVETRLVNDGPEIDNDCAYAPVQVSAMPLGGGAQTAPVSRPRVRVALMSPVTATLADPRVTDPVISGDEVGGTLPLSR